MSTQHEPNLRRFGTLIAERRKDLSITQDELARRVGWSQERISTIERGRYGLPSLPSLARLAAALDLPLGEVLESAGFPSSPSVETEPQPNPAVLLYALERILEVEGTEMHEVFEQTCTILGEALQADKVDIFLMEGATETLVAVGTSRTPMGRLQHEIGLNRVPLARGGTEVEVFQTGQTYETGLAAEDARVLPGIKSDLGVQSLIEIPVRIDGTVQGVLVISSAEPDRFTPEDRRFTEAASRWISLMMHRADLSRQLQEFKSQRSFSAPA
jgi:transcriptional regulator with XRE-family HTH domain